MNLLQSLKLIELCEKHFIPACGSLVSIVNAGDKFKEKRKESEKMISETINKIIGPPKYFPNKIK